MEISADTPIPYRIIALMQERNRLFAYPPERLAIQIWLTRFCCNGCGACCTTTINDHIFLLDSDVEEVKAIDAGACVPAPGPEFCDQFGTQYVSGYALRMREGSPGRCGFLEGTRCRIYNHRFSACRIYPHMLRRSPDRNGGIVWHQFAQRSDHGSYNQSLSFDECHELSRLIREYEVAYLNQQIAFLEVLHDYFSAHGLRHDPDVQRIVTKMAQEGEPVLVMVYHAGELHPHLITGKRHDNGKVTVSSPRTSSGAGRT